MGIYDAYRQYREEPTWCRKYCRQCGKDYGIVQGEGWQDKAITCGECQEKNQNKGGDTNE